MNIAYYITSHGFGHAVRSAAIINQFSPMVMPFIRTAVPESFFNEEMVRPFSYALAEFDCGCIQNSCLSIDINTTLCQYAKLADENKDKLAAEAAWCANNHIDGIVSDITPFAFDIAAAAGVPSIAVTNFTWYDIYHDYLAANPWFAPYLTTLKRQYGKAESMLALAPANPMPYFKKKVSIPPVGRQGSNKRELLCAHYHFDPRKKIGLIYPGNFGMGTVDFSRLESFSEWEFFSLYPLPGSPTNCHIVDKGIISYQDLTASSDCVISKLGYGTVAECMINGTPIIYMPRADFAEFPYLNQSVMEWGYGRCLTLEQYETIDWKESLDFFAHTSKPEPQLLSGAHIAAQTIEKEILKQSVPHNSIN